MTLAMYTLLPSSPAVGFVPVLVIFVTATLLGTVSHAPGSLGIIEAAMLLGPSAISEGGNARDAADVSRAYFMLPLLFATLALGVRELRLLARPESAGRNRHNRDD